MKCNCCCGCHQDLTPEEQKYYERLDVNIDTVLCFDCQDEYERETDEKEQAGLL